MLNNSLIVTRTTDESLSSSDTLDYARIFEIPQATRSDCKLDCTGSRVGVRAHVPELSGGYNRLRGWRKGRQITRGLVEGYLQQRGGPGAEYELSPSYRRRILAALRWWIRCIREQVQERHIRSALWPWKYELLSQLDLAAQVKGPRAASARRLPVPAGISRMKKPLAS